MVVSTPAGSSRGREVHRAAASTMGVGSADQAEDRIAEGDLTKISAP